MAGRKADPFNFDDIYKQAGVEDLFVKKTMGELKQRQAPTGTTSVAASQPCKQPKVQHNNRACGCRRVCHLGPTSIAPSIVQLPWAPRQHAQLFKRRRRMQELLIWTSSVSSRSCSPSFTD